MDSEVKVSVCVVTYNQENYIAECLQSLVDQETDFNFEIIVGEDCSTDQTRKIVSEFFDNYPDLIVKNYHESNVGAIKNIVSTYGVAKGKYIAHMDGDDYALPNKLQKQFDSLEKNPSCVICSHDVLLVNSSGKKSSRSFMKHDKKVNTLLDLYAQLPFFAHSSKMFLNDLNDGFWNNFSPETIDIEIHAKQAKKGNIYHINESLGVYRVNVGISNNKAGFINPLIIQGAVRVFEEALLEEVIEKEKIKYFYAKSMLEYAYQSALVSDAPGVVKYVNKSISIKRYSNAQVFFEKLLFSPRLLIGLCKVRGFIKGYRI